MALGAARVKSTALSRCWRSPVGHTAPMATPREQARTRTMAQIVRIGRAHLVTEGAAGLSLRAVARDLGVVSSAVYRYVPSRDELLTLLVVDAYDELGETVERAEAAVARSDLAGRWRALAGAVRSWALAEPSRYGLVLGAPVPGYRAPAERTTSPGTRVVALLLRLAADGEAEGATPARPRRPAPQSLVADAARVRASMGVDVGDDLLVAAVLAWTALFGAVSFEVFGQYGPDTFTDPATVFDALVDLLAGILGLHDAPGPGPG